MNILLVEDDLSLSNAVKTILEQRGFFVDPVYDGQNAVDYAELTEYSLIILDVMLPKLDGFEVLRTIRKQGIGTPILMLTAKASVPDKVAGLNWGADDYMVKPFDPEELLARVGALTRRTGELVLDEIRFSDLRLDLRSAVLGCGDRTIQLSRKEFEVMKLFLRNPSMTISKESMLNSVWGMESEATDNNVEVYVSFLRKKLKYLQSRVAIRTVQKIGYRLEVAEQ